MSKCAQCSNEAIVECGPENSRMRFCLACYQRLQQTVIATNQMYERQIDRLTDDMEMISGISLRPPRPQPIIHQGPVTTNFIHVDRSVVGSINTGTIQSLNVSLEKISLGGSDALSRCVKNFTEAVTAESSLTPEAKNSVVEQLAFVLEETQKPANTRKKSVALSAVKDIGMIVSTMNALHTLWQAISPHLVGLL